jgi:hypothetical protein
MSRLARAVAFASTLCLAVALTAGSPAVGAADDKDDKEEIKKAQKDVLDLAKEIEQGKNVSAKAAAIKKKYEDLNTVMHAYKPKEKGGIGTGIPGLGKGDGIELKLNNLGRRALAKAALQKEAAQLVKMGYINAAIAEIAEHYAPAKPKAGKGAKDWKQHSADQKKAARELIAAAQAGDSARVKTAANNINNACNNCHADFRD